VGRRAVIGGTAKRPRSAAVTNRTGGGQVHDWTAPRRRALSGVDYWLRSALVRDTTRDSSCPEASSAPIALGRCGRPRRCSGSRSSRSCVRCATKPPQGVPLNRRLGRHDAETRELDFAEVVRRTRRLAHTATLLVAADDRADRSWPSGPFRHVKCALSGGDTTLASQLSGGHAGIGPAADRVSASQRTPPQQRR
jgi:hypothetical protein